MRYLSLFSGIEACTVAWKPLGWECVGVAEIDDFPNAVLAHHYPDVPNLGSVTNITDEQIAALGHIDLVVGGSPCQDLSVAGKRKGLAGERSSLFHEQLRIFHAARTLCGARWLLWENVPGAFSTHGGRDFARVVSEMAGGDFLVPEDGWGTEGMALGEHGLLEWSVLDAQWFGVAQRRRRVFALLDVGDWADRPPVLLEPESSRGDSAPRRGEGEGVAPTLAGCANGGGANGPGRDVDSADSLQVAHSLCGEGFDASEDGTGRGTPLVSTCLSSGQANAELTDGYAPALNCNRDGAPILFSPTLGFHSRQDPVSLEESSLPLEAKGGQAVAFKPGQSASAVTMRESGQGYWMQDGIAGALRAEGENRPSRPSNVIWQPAGMQVRRLTPRECERLQGFPDDNTLIPYRGKPAGKCPDGPRYKALGNSMAVPVMRWIGRQIGGVNESEEG